MEQKNLNFDAHAPAPGPAPAEDMASGHCAPPTQALVDPASGGHSPTPDTPLSGPVKYTAAQTWAESLERKAAEQYERNQRIQGQRDAIRRAAMTGEIRRVPARQINEPSYDDWRLLIIKCNDPLMWYSQRVGFTVPYLGIWGGDGFKSRDNGGYVNVVKFTDAIVVPHLDGVPT